MTTIAAIQGDGWAVIGADSQASDDTGHTMRIVTGKIFRNGPALIAAAGSVRGINILQFGWKAPARTVKSTENYLTRSFIPAMRKAFIEAGFDMKADNEAAQNDNELIVAVGGVLYSIADDYSWERCRSGIYTAGSGGKYALGALAVMSAHRASTPEQAAKYLQKAITVAITFDAFSGGEITTATQEA